MDIILSSLAVWKISEMLMNYAGPLDIIFYLRKFIELLQNKLGKKFLNFDCMFCFSTAVSIPFSVALTSGWNIIVYWMAISAIAYIIHLFISVLENEL